MQIEHLEVPDQKQAWQDGSTNLPGNLQQFLWTDANKAELFSVLAQHITTIDTTEETVTTQAKKSLSALSGTPVGCPLETMRRPIPG